MRRWIPAVCALAALATAAVAAPSKPINRDALGFEDLKAVYKNAPLVVEVQIVDHKSNPQISNRLVWEATAKVLALVKGQLSPPKISIHVDSFIRAFDRPKSEIVGKQYLVCLEPMSTEQGNHYRLAGGYAFAAGGQEAKTLRELAETQGQKGTPDSNLELKVKPLEKVYQPDRPKLVQITLTNTGKESARYIQAPMAEADGKLYFLGAGGIRIRDNATGELLSAGPKVVKRQAPPGPPEPVLLLPKQNFSRTVDLEEYYDLKPGRYTMSVLLETPDGQGRVGSNALTIQVGTVNLPAASEKPSVPEAIEAQPVASDEVEPAARDLPSPMSYSPGKPGNGLAALLRPTKAIYELGEPVNVEVRLVNTGGRTVSVDARLERTLRLNVTSVDGSPQPLFIRQVIPWPKTDGTPNQRAWLREDGFWGRVINVNMLYGTDLAEHEGPSGDDIAAGKDLSYERFGRNLFGFTRPGTYRVTATYRVPGPMKPDKNGIHWWVGEVESNPIVIRVVKPGGRTVNRPR